jgi:hypothetical protein
MSRPEPVHRSSEWVQREYGREKWPAVARMVEEESNAESDPGRADLGRVLGRVARREACPDGALAPSQMTVAGSRVGVPRAVAHAAHQGFVLDVVGEACTPTTALVIELGSGWGRNLLSLWLSGGPASAEYVAAEYTEAGRRVAAQLAAMDPRLKFRSVAWDYRHPDLSMLGRFDEAVVFTVHSVEQLPQLPAEAIDTIRGLADRVTCLHFEPVGWQLGETEQSGSTADYAAQHDYNRNLVELLREQERQRRLNIELILPDVIGENPANSTTLIVWRASENGS